MENPLQLDHGCLIKALRGWAGSYRASPEEFWFPADLHAEFFTRDLELAASELEKCLELISTIRRECGTPWRAPEDARKNIIRSICQFKGEGY